MQQFDMIILGAGKGTRMNAALPKILHPLAGLPLVHHVCHLAHTLNVQLCVTVIAPDMKDVEQSLVTHFPKNKIAYQDKPLGTGHAVACAVDQVTLNSPYTLVHFADTPLVEATLIQEALSFMTAHAHHGVCVIGFDCPRDNAYGRVLLKENGTVDRIVEYKNATDQERHTLLCNSGLMLFRTQALKDVITSLKPNALTGEYYLTDAIELLQERGMDCGVLKGSEDDLRGINSQAELAQCEALYQHKCRQKFMTQGVTLLDPQSVYFSYDTQVAADVVIEPHVFFGPGVRVESGAHIYGFSHIQGAVIGQGAKVGPFARLRPGAVLGQDTRVGNFVEIKNTTLGQGSKASHLTYLGDAEIGTHVNIGAGTITCNYDGYRKSKTIIEDGVFIGSNSALIAPISIGQGALVAAGSTLTKDVPADALTVARAPQKDLPQGGKKFRSKALQEKVA